MKKCYQAPGFESVFRKRGNTRGNVPDDYLRSLADDKVQREEAPPVHPRTQKEIEERDWEGL